MLCRFFLHGLHQTSTWERGRDGAQMECSLVTGFIMDCTKQRHDTAEYTQQGPDSHKGKSGLRFSLVWANCKMLSLKRHHPPARANVSGDTFISRETPAAVHVELAPRRREAEFIPGGRPAGVGATLRCRERGQDRPALGIGVVDVQIDWVVPIW